MIQIVEQTKEEKVAIFIKLPKREIIEMLINCNDIITGLTKSNSYDLVCDNCKCHSSILHSTPSGRFCESCKPIKI